VTLSIGRPTDRRSPSRKPTSAPSSPIAASARAAFSTASLAGVGEIDAIVERLYVGLQQGLRRAAGRSVHAHLIDLVGRGLVESDGPPALDARYRLARS